MPWGIVDVEKHRKGLNESQKKTWIKIANGVLRTCLADNGKDCEARAIRIANAHFEKKRK